MTRIIPSLQVVWILLLLLASGLAPTASSSGDEDEEEAGLCDSLEAWSELPSECDIDEFPALCELLAQLDLQLPGHCGAPIVPKPPTLCETILVLEVPVPGQCGYPLLPETPDVCETLDANTIEIPGMCGAPLIPSVPNTCEFLASLDLHVPGQCGEPIVPSPPNYCEVLDDAALHVPGQCGEPLVPGVPDYCSELEAVDVAVPGLCGEPIVPSPPNFCEVIGGSGVAVPGQCGAPLIPTLPNLCETIEELDVKVPGQCGEPLIPGIPNHCALLENNELEVPGFCGVPLEPDGRCEFELDPFEWLNCEVNEILNTSCDATPPGCPDIDETDGKVGENLGCQGQWKLLPDDEDLDFLLPEFAWDDVWGPLVKAAGFILNAIPTAGGLDIVRTTTTVEYSIVCHAEDAVVWTYGLGGALRRVSLEMPPDELDDGEWTRSDCPYVTGGCRAEMSHPTVFSVPQEGFKDTHSGGCHSGSDACIVGPPFGVAEVCLSPDWKGINEPLVEPLLVNQVHPHKELAEARCNDYREIEWVPARLDCNVPGSGPIGPQHCRPGL